MLKHKWMLSIILLCVGMVYIIVFFVFSADGGDDDEMYQAYLEMGSTEVWNQSIGTTDEYISRIKEAISGNTAIADTTVDSGSIGDGGTDITYTGEGISVEGIDIKVDPTSKRGKVVQAAIAKLGYPYVYGGNGVTPFTAAAISGHNWTDPKYTMESRIGMPSYDCSSFIQMAYKNGVGMSIPRTSGPQASTAYGATKLASTADMQPGDIAGDSGHVVMYIGNGNIIEAPSSGKTVRIIAIKDRWSKGDFPASYTRVSYL